MSTLHQKVHSVTVNQGEATYRRHTKIHRSSLKGSASITASSTRQSSHSFCIDNSLSFCKDLPLIFTSLCQTSHTHTQVHICSDDDVSGGGTCMRPYCNTPNVHTASESAFSHGESRRGDVQTPHQDPSIELEKVRINHRVINAAIVS